MTVDPLATHVDRGYWIVRSADGHVVVQDERAVDL